MQFKDLTENIVNCIHEEKLEYMDAYIKERQDVIESIEKLNYTKEEFKNICEEINLDKYEGMLSKAAIDKKEELKCKIQKMKINKNANLNYNKNSIIKRNFFSTKI